ncbi:MAG: Flp family type IVb pilin [Marinicaulis sp.]|nr:Flp family type IVb pilin [Marinicaulis sp.]NNL89725.1 Flp family type IVb pilin [Marinicaulis sp.]
MLKLYIQGRELTRELKIKGREAADKLRSDTEGASLIEYSLLIGLITAAVVATIATVGGKLPKYWNDLNGALP